MKTIIIFLITMNNVLAFDLEVKIKNIRSSQGDIKVALFKGPRGFPDDDDSAIRSEIVNIENKRATVIFKDLEEGDYAISMYHDINANFRLDTRFGIPREPLGFSNNPRLFGKPRFNACKVSIIGDKKISVRLKKIF